MPKTATLGINVDVKKGLQDLKRLKEMLESLGINVSKSFEDTVTAQKDAATKQIEQIDRVRKKYIDDIEERDEAGKKQYREILARQKRVEDAQKAAATVEERVNKSKEKGIDEVRQKIYSLEYDKRKLAVETANLTEKEDIKANQQKNKLINAELQLYRSAEKEMTGGRTFTEQLEKNFKATVTNIHNETNSVTNNIHQTLNALQQNYNNVSEKIKKEEDGKQRYILERQKETIAKEIAQNQKLVESYEKDAQKEIKSQQQVTDAQKHEGGGAFKGGLAEGLGIGAAIEGFKMLKEHAAEANAGMSALQAGTNLEGEALKKQGEEAAKMADHYALAAPVVQTAMGQIAGYSGLTGKKLNQATEDAIVLSQSLHIPIEKASKMMGKSLDADTAAQLSSLGIRVDASMTAEQRMAAIHEAAMKRKAGVDKANMDANTQLQRVLNKVMDTVGDLAASLLNALVPAITSLMPVLNTLGSVASDILKPILGALTPIVQLLSNTFKELAPPIADLVQNVFSVLEPIVQSLVGVFSDLLPIIMDLVKQVVTALSPVFKGLQPIITQLAGLFGQELSMTLKALLIPTLEVLTPILTQVLAPILVALMPLIQNVANILSAVLTPAMKIFSDIVDWLTKNVLHPLVGYLTGAVTSAINSVVGVVTKVVGAINDIIHTVGKLIGVSSDAAKESVKKTGEEVVQQQAETNQKILDQNADFSQAEVAQIRLAEQQHTMTQAQINEARVRAEKNHNSVVLALLATAQRNVDSQNKHGAAMAVKAVKDKWAAEKEQIENNFADKKTLLETQAIQENEDDATLKYNELQLDVAHAQDLYNLAEKSGKGIAAAKLNLLKAQAAINKLYREDELNDEKEAAAEKQKIQDETNKELEAQQKTEESIEQKRVDAMASGVDKELALQKLKHDKELAQLQDALDKKQTTQKQYDELHRISEQQNANAILDIYKKQGQVYMQDLKDANVFVAKTGQERVAAIKGFLLQELAQYVITKYAEVSATEATEGQKTAITLGGIASRVAATAGEIASDIASAAASAFTAVVNTIRWITTIFPFPFSLALIPAGIAAVYGLYKGAKSLFKFAEGGIVDQPTNFMFGNGQQGQFGEAGKEAIIPLKKFPEVLASVLPRPALSNVSVDHTGALVKQLETANAKLTEIHTATLIKPPPATIDGYKMDLSIQKSQTRVNLAKLK